jgi:hypothetical protein
MNHLKPLKNMSIPYVTRMLALACATLLTACTYSTGSFDEPGLRGKLIDAETNQPVQGAVIYGYYATAEGSLGGGETIKEILRVFEVESDANGVFEIPAWKTTWSITRGEPRQRFPAIAIYKDGYKLDLQNLSKIADWVSQTKLPGSGKRAGNVIDWTASPTQLKPTTTELERYNALKNSNYAYADVGECGWEQHVKLLVAQHGATKSWVRRNVPSDQIGANGYAKPTYFHPEPLLGGLWGNPTSVDSLRSAYARKPKASACANPNEIFGRE